MISAVRGHVRYKANWLLAFAVNEFNSLTRDNRPALRSWLGQADKVEGENEHWEVRDKHLGNVVIVSGPSGTTYNLKWNHWTGNYQNNFRNKSWLYFFRQFLNNTQQQ